MSVVVVVGASSDRSRFSNKAVRAFLQKGHAVYPVNPREQTIETLECHACILDVPVRPDIVSVYVRPERVLKLLPDIARRGCGELWLNPGTVSDEVLREADMFGLKAVEICSIVALGFLPDSL